MSKSRRGAIAVAATFTFLVVSPALASDSAIKCKEKVDLIFVTGLANEDIAAVTHVEKEFKMTHLDQISNAIMRNDIPTADMTLYALRGELTFSMRQLPNETRKTVIENVDAAYACVKGL